MCLALAACGDDEGEPRPAMSGTGGEGGGQGGQGGQDGQGGQGGQGGEDAATEARADGEPCTYDDECSGGLCMTEDAFGWAGGYCSSLCAQELIECGAGSVCLAAGSDFSLCIKTCQDTADCTGAAQECVELNGAAVCLGGCNSDDQCQGFCDDDSALCSTLDEDCDNERDDDGDDLQDCEELDCSDACAASVAAACTAAIDVSEGGTFTGTTESGTRLFSAACPDFFGSIYPAGVGESEQVFQFVAPAKGSFRVVATSTAGDFDWYIRTSCDDPSTLLGCLLAYPPGEPPLELLVEAGETYFIFIEGQLGSPAEYVLDVDFKEQVCGDGALVGTELCDDGNEVDDDVCSNACEVNPAAACAAAVPVADAAAAGDTSEGVRAFEGSCAGAGPDLVYRYSPEASGNVTITATPTGAADLVLHARTDCADEASELECTDAGFSGEAESITVEVTAGTPIDIFVDTYDNVAAGPFELTITQD
ncbi:DUF4215 domain-containing protein [Sorangium cellulosum]|nr:DUF4215 domain-containing protein [Sorangium cellulosum]